jgi:hypothetical protein
VSGFTVRLGSAETSVGTGGLTSAEAEQLMTEYETLGFVVEVDR